MSSMNHTFDVELAAKFGIEEAILIHHFQFWINHNKSLGKNFKDGRTWSYQTRKGIAAWFLYWTEDQVRRLTDNLVELKVLIKGNYNKSGIDKTIWYAFENEKKFTTGNSANWTGNSANWTGNSAKPIPDTKTDTKTNKELFVVADPVGPSTGHTEYLCGHKKKNVEFDKSQMYCMLVSHKVTWSPEEIEYAWKTLVEYDGLIYDVWKFLEGTVKKYKNHIKSKNISGENKWKKKKEKRESENQENCNKYSSVVALKARPCPEFH